MFCYSMVANVNDYGKCSTTTQIRSSRLSLQKNPKKTRSMISTVVFGKIQYVQKRVMSVINEGCDIHIEILNVG